MVFSDWIKSEMWLLRMKRYPILNPSDLLYKSTVLVIDLLLKHLLLNSVIKILSIIEPRPFDSKFIQLIFNTDPQWEKTEKMRFTER
jgi:hypothetical protein